MSGRRRALLGRGRALPVPLALLLLVVLAPPAAAQGVELDTAGPGTAVGLWAVRLLNHVALAATVGLLLVPAWLLRATGPSATGRRATRLAAVTAGVWALSAVGVLVFGVSNAAARPLPQALDGELLGRFVETRFGGAVAVQAAAGAAVALVAATARNRAAAMVALVGALLSALAPAWWGHAGTAGPAAVLADWLHIGAASVWVGGLLAVTVLVLGRGGIAAHGPTARFSQLAGWAIAVVAATGVVNTALHVGALDQLVSTGWGRIALAKALLLVALAAFGWAQRRRTVPLLEGAGHARARRLFTRLAVAELVVMLGAFGLATTMASGLPAEAEAAARIQTFTTPLGDGFAEVTLDPAATGANEVHLYLFGADGRSLRPFEEATMVLRRGDLVVEPRLLRSGTGHLVGTVEVPAPGTWSVELAVGFDGQVERATAALDVR